MFETAAQSAALQRALTRNYDSNRDGRVAGHEAALMAAETGLSVRDLTKRCVDADLAKLAAAAQAEHLLPDVVTGTVPNAYSLQPRILARELRRANWRKGMSEYRQQHKALWKEVDLHTNYKWARPKDYLELETWRRGARRFYETGRYLMLDSWLLFVR